MYAIRTRNGSVYMMLKKNYGNMSALEVGAGLQGRCATHTQFTQPADCLWWWASVKSGAGSCYGQTPCTQEDLSLEEKQFKAERSGGNYGIGTKEVQEKNYVAVSGVACERGGV